MITYSGFLLQSLAAEVVALEEKVLQVRSREIRLEKKSNQLQEGLQEAEKQLQASQRDGASLQSTIEMLQVHDLPSIVLCGHNCDMNDCDALSLAGMTQPACRAPSSCSRSANTLLSIK